MHLYISTLKQAKLLKYVWPNDIITRSLHPLMTSPGLIYLTFENPPSESQRTAFPCWAVFPMTNIHICICTFVSDLLKNAYSSRMILNYYLHMQLQPCNINAVCFNPNKHYRGYMFAHKQKYVLCILCIHQCLKIMNGRAINVYELD